MSTTTVQTMARPTHTTTSRGADPHSNRGASLSIKDLLINDLTDGAAGGSTDDGFYSADLFDSVDEEAFIQAQRDAFTAINDAALARAIQESEILAAKKAAEENRWRMANASATGRASRASSSAAAYSSPAPANVGPYALVSPSELGQSSSRPRRSSSAAVPVASPSLASSSRPSPSAPPPAKSSSPSRSQYPSTSTSVSTSSPLSLSTSASPPSRINPATSYGPSTVDRQQSSRYYPTQNQRPAMVSQSKVTSTPSVPATMTRTTTTPRQAAPNHSSMTTNMSNHYSSNISATPATARAPSSSNAPSSTSRSAGAAPPSTTPPRPAPATWKPPTIPFSSTPSPAIAIPRSKEMPIPRSGPAMSASASARDLRMGMMVSGSPNANHGIRLANARHGSSPKPIPGRGRRGRKFSPGPEARWARAKGFLSRNCERECKKCGWAVEGAAGSAPIPTEQFSYLLLRHLHVTCSNPDCRATYCRGCFSSVDGLCQPTESSASSSPSSSASSSPAPSRKGSFSSSAQPSRVTPGRTTCQGSRGCDIKSCCPFASITAISTILDAFDMEFTRAAYASGFSSPASFVEEAQAFVQVVIARTNSDVKNTKAFEGVVIRSLHAVSSWLVVFQERREEEEDDSDDEELVNRRSKPDLVQDLLYPLISRSLLPSLVHAFLQNRNVGDWLRHSEIYVLILDVLRKLVDNGLGRVLDEPIVTVDESQGELSSSPEYRWRSGRTRGPSSSPETSTSESSSGGEDESSESERETETDETSPAEDSDDDDDSDEDDEDKRKTLHGSDISSTPTQTVSSARGAFAVTRLPIRALVAKLEEHRAPLMAFGATVKFPATKSKVHTLCDGISYLLLQQLFAAD